MMSSVRSRSAPPDYSGGNYEEKNMSDEKDDPASQRYQQSLYNFKTAAPWATGLVTWALLGANMPAAAAGVAAGLTLKFGFDYATNTELYDSFRTTASWATGLITFALADQYPSLHPLPAAVAGVAVGLGTNLVFDYVAKLKNG
jgi:hypothetical protein